MNGSNLFRSRVEHDAAVARLVDAVRSRGSRQLRLGKKTSNLFRHRSSHAGGRLEVEGLDKTISVSEDGFAEVQGMATFEDFADACLVHGFAPPVVPELKTITIGGAVTGIGIESSSFKRGFVHESVVEMDILCGDGELRTCRPEGPNADLFHAFPNSYGTLGYALRLRVKLDRVRRNVQLTYRRFPDKGAFLAALEATCALGDAPDGPDFVEGVAFGPNDWVLSTGWRTAEEGATSDVAGPVPYYKTLRTKEQDLLTSRDHLWRWDADWFWCSRTVGFQKPWIRALAGRRWLTSSTYWKIHALLTRHRVVERLNAAKRALGIRPRLEEVVIQDVEIPFGRCPEFLEFYWKTLEIHPLWICPVVPQPSRAPWTLYDVPQGLHLNFGFWSAVDTRDDLPPDHFNRLLEREVVRLGGHKSLYSSVHFEEDEFWSLYDGTSYRELKAKYDPSGALPDLFQKAVKSR